MLLLCSAFAHTTFLNDIHEASSRDGTWDDVKVVTPIHIWEDRGGRRFVSVGLAQARPINNASALRHTFRKLATRNNSTASCSEFARQHKRGLELTNPLVD